jgi:signal transduction histidine kinase
MRRLQSLGLRGRLVLTVVVTVGALLGALVGAFNVVLDNRLDHEVNAILGARATSGIGRVHITGDHVAAGRPRGPGEPDTPLWIFAGRKVLLEPPEIDPRTAAAAHMLADGPRRNMDLRDGRHRMLAVPVIHDGRRRATVVTGLSIVSYRKIRKVALVASVTLGLTVLLIVALAAWWLVTRSLRPVVRMTKQAADWSENDLERRFAKGPAEDELSQLAASLDELLDRVAAALRHEQRFSAEVSHELRTPLAGIVAEAQLALRHPHTAEEYRDAFARVAATADHMRGVLTTLLATAQSELDGTRSTSAAADGVSAAARECASVAARHGVQLSVEIPPELRVGAREELVERIVAPLLENACRYGRTRVNVSATARPGAIVYTVDDDGPGVGEDEREAIFEPGRRGGAGNAMVNGDAGAGLGLALSRRLARKAGGDVHAVPSSQGGRFLAHLPRG